MSATTAELVLLALAASALVEPDQCGNAVQHPQNVGVAVKRACECLQCDRKETNIPRDDRRVGAGQLRGTALRFRAAALALNG